MSQLDIAEVIAEYGAVRVLDGVSFTVGSGEVTSLIGPSGSGKSTLLRVIVGLLKPCSGAVKLDGVAVDYDRPGSVRTMRDQCAIVFQQFNLFQNMTALQNVTVGPIRIKRRPVKEVTDEAMTLLDRVGLADKAGRYPDELSGGQQQRVAIARALALHPKFLLLDEVTSALDPELVTEVLAAIKMLARDGMTMLVVSHEMAFVREVSTQVVMMADGKVVERGKAADIFHSPRVQRTRDFLARSLAR